MTRRAIIILCIISSTVILAVVTLIVLPKLIDTSDYRHDVARWLSMQLGRPVTVGDLTFSVVTGPKIILKDLSIDDDPKFSLEPFLTAREVDVSLRLVPLLVGSAVVNGITITDPVVSIIEKDSSLLNIATLRVYRNAESPVSILKTNLLDLDIASLSDRISLPEKIDVRDAAITYVRLCEEVPEEVVRLKGVDIRINHILAAGKSEAGVSAPPSIPFSGDVSITITTGFIKELVFDDLNLTGTIKNDILRIDKMSAAIFGGTLDVGGYIDISAQKKELVVNAILSDIMANKFFSLIRKQDNSCFGVMNFEGTFTATGKTTGEMIDNLTGGGLVRIEDGHIPAFNIRTELSALGLIANKEMTEMLDTSFSIIGGSFVLSGTKFVTSKLAFKSEEWDAVVKGEIDLNGAIDCNGDIFLSNAMAFDIKPEYITSLLHDNTEKLSLPFSITGDIEDIEFLLRPEFLTEKDADEIFEEFNREIIEKYKKGYSIKFINRIAF